MDMEAASSVSCGRIGLDTQPPGLSLAGWGWLVVLFLDYKKALPFSNLILVT